MKAMTYYLLVQKVTLAMVLSRPSYCAKKPKCEPRLASHCFLILSQSHLICIDEPITHVVLSSFLYSTRQEGIPCAGAALSSKALPAWTSRTAREQALNKRAPLQGMEQEHKWGVNMKTNSSTQRHVGLVFIWASSSAQEKINVRSTFSGLVF